MLYEYNFNRPKISPSAFISDSATIIGNVTIGDYCYIGPGAVIRSERLPIVIGDETAVEDGVIIHTGGAKSNGTIIGKRVTIGHGAIIHANRIDNNANIGMGAIISLFSEVGEYAVVAEGAVVRSGQVIPPRVVIGGTPAKVLRELMEKDIDAWSKSKDMYVQLVKNCNTPELFKPVER